MKIFLKAAGVAALALACLFIGYLYGRQYADLRAYYIGVEHGQADGMATAEAAYESGGKVHRAGK